MLSLSDSFIEYLAASVTALPVHWVRVTADDGSHLLKTGHLNVAILAVLQNGSLEEALVSLDIIGTDERESYVWAEAVIDTLRDPQYTPELNYSPDPASPTPTGKLVHWEADRIRFQVVEAAPLYLHLNATFPICHAR